jgi:hypothetical protein
VSIKATMSELGQSQHKQRTPESIDIRFAPKATVSSENAVRRFGPTGDQRHCQQNASVCRAGQSADTGVRQIVPRRGHLGARDWVSIRR